MNDEPRDQGALALSTDTPAADAFARDPRVVFSWAHHEAEDHEAVPADTPEPPSTEADAARVRRELGRLTAVPPAELLAGLDGALASPRVVEVLRALQRLGVLALLLPEVDALVGFHRSCPVHHKDLWDHTLKVIARMVPDVDLRWAALMHDAGKIATRVVGEDGKVAFLRHEPVGAWLMLGVARRLGFSEERAQRIAFVIEQHGRVNAYEKSWSDRAVGRFARDAGAYLEDLLAFSSADYTTQRSAKATRIQESLAHLRARLARLAEEQAAPRTFPRGLGAQVAQILGIRPGPPVGEAMRWLTEQVEAGHLPPAAPATVYLDAIQAHEGPFTVD